jgi:large subunit ribosomal protein L1
LQSGRTKNKFAITTKGIKMAKKSKKYAAAQAQIPAEPLSPLAAMNLLKEISTANFDETVTGDFRLGIDTRQADQQLRGTVSLPNGSGKEVRVAVFAEGDAAKAAKEAGADIVGTDEITEMVNAGNFDFDAAVATPDQMGKVGRLGKILGPRGLMPNPKLGTVTTDVAKAIKELKGGRVEYRADRYGICHVVLGKVSFSAEQLAENYGAVYDEIIRMKPAAAKGKYVKSVTVSATMTPGVSVDSSVTRAYAETVE